MDAPLCIAHSNYLKINAESITKLLRSDQWEKKKTFWRLKNKGSIMIVTLDISSQASFIYITQNHNQFAS